MKDHGIKRGIPLPVSAPFHCPLMQPAADAMAAAFERTPPGRSPAALCQCHGARTTDPADVTRLLVEQVTGRVRWRESVLAMRAAGVEKFVELGGKVLGPMIARIDRDAAVVSVQRWTTSKPWQKNCDFTRRRRGAEKRGWKSTRSAAKS